CTSNTPCTGGGSCVKTGYHLGRAYYFNYDFEDYDQGDSRNPTDLGLSVHGEASCPSCMNPTNRTPPSQFATLTSPTGTCSGGANNGLSCTSWSDCPGGTCTSSSTGYKVLATFPKVCWGGNQAKQNTCSNSGTTCTADAQCSGGFCTRDSVFPGSAQRKSCACTSGTSGCCDSGTGGVCAYMPTAADVANVYVTDVPTVYRGFRRARMPRTCTPGAGGDTACGGDTGSCVAASSRGGGSSGPCAAAWSRGAPPFAEAVPP